MTAAQPAEGGRRMSGSAHGHRLELVTADNDSVGGYRRILLDGLSLDVVDDGIRFEPWPSRAGSSKIAGLLTVTVVVAELAVGPVKADAARSTDPASHPGGAT